MLHQRFIELGNGYGDVYELCELIETNSRRLHKAFILASTTPSGKALSLAAAFEPASDSNFMPIYLCREGIVQQGDKKSKRRLLFEQTVEKLNEVPVYIEVKSASDFADLDLFFQYVTGILRLNHLLPPLR